MNSRTCQSVFVSPKNSLGLQQPLRNVAFVNEISPWRAQPRRQRGVYPGSEQRGVHPDSGQREGAPRQWAVGRCTLAAVGSGGVHCGSGQWGVGQAVKFALAFWLELASTWCTPSHLFGEANRGFCVAVSKCGFAYSFLTGKIKTTPAKEGGEGRRPWF